LVAAASFDKSKVGHTYKDFPLAKTPSWLRTDSSINVTAAVCDDPRARMRGGRTWRPRR
jgi:hypothetical protein